MTARVHLLTALATLHAELEAVRHEAEVEGDCWAGVAADMVSQAVADAAQAAEVERRIRGER